MKKAEREKLHEDDRFVRFVSDTWDKVTARRRAFTLGLIILLAVLGTGVAVIAVLEERGDARRTAAETAETIEEMEAVAEEYPDEPYLLLRLGTAYALRNGPGDLVKAESVLVRARAEFGDEMQSALAAFQLGVVRFDLGKHEEALALFTAAGQDPQARVLLGNELTWQTGRCLHVLGQTDEAAERYNGIVNSKTGASLWKQPAGYARTKLRREALD